MVKYSYIFLFFYSSIICHAQLSVIPEEDAVQVYLYTTQLLLLGKFEYTGGPIFKVVLEC